MMGPHCPLNPPRDTCRRTLQGDFTAAFNFCQNVPCREYTSTTSAISLPRGRGWRKGGEQFSENGFFTRALFCKSRGILVPLIQNYLYKDAGGIVNVARVTNGSSEKMAEESSEISSMTVIGIGVVLFIVVVGIWYMFLK